MNSNLSRLVKISLFIALSVVGAMLKIPSPTGTVAFDSLPGYLGAVIIGKKEGAVIAGLGHLASAATAGFFLTLPVHLYVALQMAVVAYLFGFLKEKVGLWFATGVAILLNGVALPAMLIPIPGFGTAMFAALLLPLLVGSAANIILATIISKRFTGGKGVGL